MKTVKFATFGDGHAPHTDKAARDKALGIVSDFAPDYFVYLGDGIDGKPASAHLNEYQHSLMEEYDSLENDQLKPIMQAVPKKCKLIYMKGNHDDWIQRENRLAPDIREACAMERHVESFRRGKWNIHEYVRNHPAGVFRLGQVAFIHGFETSDIGLAKQTAEVAKYYGLAVFGHTHRPTHTYRQITLGSSLSGTPLPFYYCNVGCMLSMANDWNFEDKKPMDYMKIKSMVNWGQSVLLGEVVVNKSPREDRYWDIEHHIFERGANIHGKHHKPAFQSTFSKEVRTNPDSDS